MSRELAQLIEALGLAQHAHTDFELSLAAGQNSGWLEWRPPANYDAAILYWFTYGDIISRVFQIESAQAGYTIGTKVVGPDEINLGVACWLYITDRDPLLFKATNLDVAAQPLYCTLWHSNVDTMQKMAIIKYVLWEHAAPKLYKRLIKAGLMGEIETLPRRILDEE